MLLLWLLVLGLASAQDLQCHVEGECEGQFTGLTQQNDYNDCLQNCKEEANCHWFTFSGDDQFCLHYENCPSIGDTCQNCHSGQKECTPAVAICNVHGFCEGFAVGFDTAESAHECLTLCQQYENCNFYSYFSESNACVLTEDCTFVDESCSDCIYGERNCYEELPVFDKLFVVGGQGAYYKAEIVDLSTDNRTCPPIPDYPGADRGSVGTYIGNQVLVCGGFPYTSNCYYYEPSNNSWVQTYSMLEERGWFAAVQFSPTEWWVTGDYATDAASTEVYNVGQGFSPYVDLPEGRGDHSLVRINSTHYMLVGADPATRSVWIFDRNLEEWMPIQDLQYPREESHAGLVKYPNGTQAVMVAGGVGGTRSTEVFDLVNQIWQPGPDLPVGIYAGASVQYKDSFLIIGGYGGGDYLDSIYMYNTAEDNWMEMAQKLEVGRMYTAAFLVPSDFIQCT